MADGDQPRFELLADGVTVRHLGRDKPSALPTELADHDGHESREAGENGDSAQDAIGAEEEEESESEDDCKCNLAVFLYFIRYQT